MKDIVFLCLFCLCISCTSHREMSRWGMLSRDTVKTEIYTERLKIDTIKIQGTKTDSTISVQIIKYLYDKGKQDTVKMICKDSIIIKEKIEPSQNCFINFDSFLFKIVLGVMLMLCMYFIGRRFIVK